MQRAVSAHPFLPAGRGHPAVLVASVLMGTARLGPERSPDQTGCPFGRERGALPPSAGPGGGRRLLCSVMVPAGMDQQRREPAEHAVTSHTRHHPLLGVRASSVPRPSHPRFTFAGDVALVGNTAGPSDLAVQAHAGREGLGTWVFSSLFLGCRPWVLLFGQCADQGPGCAGMTGQSAHLQEQAAGRGEEARGWTRSRGAAPSSLSRGRALCGDTCPPVLANLQLLPSEPRAHQGGPARTQAQSRRSGGCHPTDGHRFTVTGSAFSDGSVTGLGDRVPRERG